MSAAPRWVAFLKPLEQPFQVAAGQVVKLEPKVLEDLRRAPGGEDAVLDVTPKPLSLLLNAAGLLTKGQTAAALYPHACGTCGTVEGARFTVCEECGDMRRVLAPLRYTARSALAFRAQWTLALELHWEHRAGRLQALETSDDYRAYLDQQHAFGEAGAARYLQLKKTARQGAPDLP